MGWRVDNVICIDENWPVWDCEGKRWLFVYYLHHTTGLFNSAIYTRNKTKVKLYPIVAGWLAVIYLMKNKRAGRTLSWKFCGLISYTSDITAVASQAHSFVITAHTIKSHRLVASLKSSGARVCKPFVESAGMWRTRRLSHCHSRTMRPRWDDDGGGARR